MALRVGLGAVAIPFDLGRNSRGRYGRARAELDERAAQARSWCGALVDGWRGRRRLREKGMIEGDLKTGALASASALILPSHQENFGLAVAEALSFGTPVLISRQVNIAETIETAGAGFAEPDNLAGTRRLIERWLEFGNPSMRDAALRCFQSHFDIEHSAGELLRVCMEESG